MIQFYLLSILLNIVSGYALTQDNELRPGVMAGIRELLQDETVRLILGVLTMVVGFFKILSCTRGDVPVIGDLLPALGGLAAGFSLLFDFYKARSGIKNENAERMEMVFIKNRRWIGYGAMVSAFLHFLFPAVMFV